MAMKKTAVIPEEEILAAATEENINEHSLHQTETEPEPDRVLSAEGAPGDADLIDICQTDSESANPEGMPIEDAARNTPEAPVDYDLTRAEQVRRTDLAQKARRMILSHMKVEAEDETSLTLDHRGYYMQISFSPLHPLLVVCLAKAIRNPDGARKQQLANELNLHSVLGSHAINEDVGCYSYRATHWLDTELTPERFFEKLSRCVDEADRGYFNLAG